MTTIQTFLSLHSLLVESTDRYEEDTQDNASNLMEILPLYFSELKPEHYPDLVLILNKIKGKFTPVLEKKFLTFYQILLSKTHDYLLTKARSLKCAEDAFTLLKHDIIEYQLLGYTTEIRYEIFERLKTLLSTLKDYRESHRIMPIFQKSYNLEIFRDQWNTLALKELEKPNITIEEINTIFQNSPPCSPSTDVAFEKLYLLVQKNAASQEDVSHPIE